MKEFCHSSTFVKCKKSLFEQSLQLHYLMEMNNYLEDILKYISCPFITIAVASPVGPSKHGLLTTFTATYVNSLLWNRHQSNPIRKQLVSLLTDLPLLNKKAHLAWVVDIVAHRVQSWVKNADDNLSQVVCAVSSTMKAEKQEASSEVPDWFFYLLWLKHVVSFSNRVLSIFGRQPTAVVMACTVWGLEFPQLTVHCPSWCQH